MKLNNVIIFSMNRAAQLDLLLTSIKQYAPWMWPPTILYRSTSDLFDVGYSILADEHQIGLMYQLPLKEKLLAAIDRLVPFTTMLCDDSVFFRALPEIPWLQPETAYATHLGKNCTYSYPVNKPQKEGELDFLTSWGIDGHIYRTDDLTACLHAVEFSTPNKLEEAMGQAARPLKLLYADHSSMVTIPANVVQHEFPNRSAGGSVGELNGRYLAGERLDLDAMDFSNVIGGHQEIPFVWKHKG